MISLFKYYVAYYRKLLSSMQAGWLMPPPQNALMHLAIMSVQVPI